jgi:hypothetical protein
MAAMNRKEDQVRKIFIGCVLGLLACTGTARAQDATRWGVSTSFVPTWTVPDNLKVVFGGVPDPGASASAFNVTGSEFRIGFVRGQDFGGDKGVSFVRKKFARDSRIAERNIYNSFDFRGRPITVTEGFDYALDGVTLTGVEYDRFRPFATIKNRAQIGLYYGGGIGFLQGDARGVRFDSTGTTSEVRPANALYPEDDKDVALLNVAGVSLKPVPLAKFELAVAGIVAPGLKVRASGGFNFPGYQKASISVVYLFGSR